MADQDFEINIRTLADLTGIKLTQAQLDALQRSAAEGNQKAAQALRQLADAQKQAQSSFTAGTIGSAAAVGTMISFVTSAINKWQAFNAELDKQVENMIKAEEKARALGESILAVQDAMISARRIDTEPLEQSFVRLQQEIIRLKVEQSLLDLPTQGEEWKKLNAEISKTESQLRGVTSAMQKQKDEADRLAKANEKAAEKKASEKREFESKALESASPQARAILEKEEAARRAREAGEGNLADRLQKSAEAFKRGATPNQLSEAEQLSKLLIDQNVILGQIRDAWR